jgi:hypothetical protein
MSFEHTDQYKAKRRAQLLRTAGPKEYRHFHELYREDIYKLMGKLVEIIEIHGRNHKKNKIAAEKFEKVEHFAKVNNGWPGPRHYDSHQPTKDRDRRAEGKGTADLHCDDCNHNYDIWQAKCPRCAKLAEKEYERILAENKNFKSFFSMVLGEDENPVEIHINQNFPLTDTSFRSKPKKRRGTK